MESKRWPIHFFFAARFLNKPGRPVEEQATFNRRQYKADDRRFVLGTVTHCARRRSLGVRSVRGRHAVARGDRGRVPADRAIASSSARRCAYRPVPPHHERDVERARALMPVVTTDELFGKIRYQPLELGEAFGYLRVIARGARFEPAAAAAVRHRRARRAARPTSRSSRASSPTSCRRRSGTSTCSATTARRRTWRSAAPATSAEREARSTGKLVHLRVGAQRYPLEPRHAGAGGGLVGEQAARRRASGAAARRPRRRPAGARGASSCATSRSSARRRRSSRRGAPAAAAARTPRALRAAVPRVRALPRARTASIAGSTAMLADPALPEATREARARGSTRSGPRSTAAPVPPDDRRRRWSRASADAARPAGKVRLRSSHERRGSRRVQRRRPLPLDARRSGRSRADVARGLREVWASAWPWAAFDERELLPASITRTVAMAILVQESIDDDVVNGVAITANPFCQGHPAFFINAQVSGGSVTGRAAATRSPSRSSITRTTTADGFERISRARRWRAGRIIMDDAVVDAAARSTSRRSTARSPTTIVGSLAPRRRRRVPRPADRPRTRHRPGAPVRRHLGPRPPLARARRRTGGQSPTNAILGGKPGRLVDSWPSG